MNVGSCENCPLPVGNETVFCPRHNVYKTAHLRNLCRTSPKYFARWEAGLFAGQTKSRTADYPSEKTLGSGLIRNLGKQVKSSGCRGCGKKKR